MNKYLKIVTGGGFSLPGISTLHKGGRGHDNKRGPRRGRRAEGRESKPNFWISRCLGDAIAVFHSRCRSCGGNNAAVAGRRTCGIGYRTWRQLAHVGALRRWADTDGVKTSRHHRERRVYRLCSGLTLRAGGDARPYKGPDAVIGDVEDAVPYRG